VSKRPLLEFTDKGIYCSRGNFYIDPWRKVDYAIITHAHSDHAYPGSRAYLAHEQSAEVLRLRLGKHIQLQTLVYGQAIFIGGVKISLHPAGHIIGSAQVRVEYKEEVWVVSGDYKTEEDGISVAFEAVPCHAFITESTFGLPIYDWQSQHIIFQQMNDWWKANREDGKATFIGGYSLGKAQHILHNIDHRLGPVYVHQSISDTNRALAFNGAVLPTYKTLTSETSRRELQGAFVLCPPTLFNSSWIKKIEAYETGYCSGWMSLRNFRKRMNVNRGFVLSDHADWKGLNAAIRATGAERVFVTHGYAETLARSLREDGLDAEVVQTLYGGEGDDDHPDLPDNTGEERL
jgi:putative mRNA 3-end processing factor